jgi:hypothetical protein
MARLSPEQQIQRLRQAIRGWEIYAPNSTFSRRTLAQFKEAMRPSLEAHDKVTGLREALRVAIAERNGLTGKAMQIFYITGFAVRGDPEQGRDSDLSEAFGYTREVVRRARIRRNRAKHRVSQTAR